MFLCFDFLPRAWNSTKVTCFTNDQWTNIPVRLAKGEFAMNTGNFFPTNLAVCHDLFQHKVLEATLFDLFKPGSSRSQFCHEKCNTPWGSLRQLQPDDGIFHLTHQKKSLHLDLSQCEALRRLWGELLRACSGEVVGSSKSNFSIQKKSVKMRLQHHLVADWWCSSPIWRPPCWCHGPGSKAPASLASTGFAASARAEGPWSQISSLPQSPLPASRPHPSEKREISRYWTWLVAATYEEVLGVLYNGGSIACKHVFSMSDLKISNVEAHETEKNTRMSTAQGLEYSHLPSHRNVDKRHGDFSRWPQESMVTPFEPQWSGRGRPGDCQELYSTGASEVKFQANWCLPFSFIEIIDLTSLSKPFSCCLSFFCTHVNELTSAGLRR